MLQSFPASYGFPGLRGLAGAAWRPGKLSTAYRECPDPAEGHGWQPVRGGLRWRSFPGETRHAPLFRGRARRDCPDRARRAPASAADAASAKPVSRFAQDPYASTYRPIGAPAVLIRDATVLTGTGTRLDEADVLMRDGRIVAVGRDLDAPADAVQVDGRGKWVTPGLIDVHSHLGVYPSPGASAHSDGNEATAPTTPNVWAEHSVWPQDPGFATALAGGVTAMQVLPGSANLIGGRGVTLKNVPATTYQAMKFRARPGG